ncbi:MAG: arginine--tRNA ligase [Deltaproteobacteria bacterium]|nr:arginine--tRNA ligase [Deltaproteobacteria bacterium]
MAQHTPLHRSVADAVAAATGSPAADIKVDTAPKAEMGDLAVAAFPYAKALGKKPNEVAAEIAAAFRPTGLLASASATGPFVNFRADRATTLRWLVDAALRDRLIPRDLGEGRTICIDYSSPNISKHLAYHHIRSTVIGHALAQIFRALGYRVVGINHLGDWGTTHGMLLAAWALWGPPADRELDITALNDLYVRFREAMKQNPDLENQGRMWFKRLEDGDAEARALWQRFRDISLAEYEAVYVRLGIKFDEVRGESAYEPDLARVMKELREKNLVTTSDGAQVVELEGEKTPILLQTRDGTTLYATRDVAAAEYRWGTYHFERSLYVVDRGQALHFRQLFKLLGRMGHDWVARCQHVPFGLVRLGGKKTGTRTGNVVLLRDVLDEAERDVREVIAQVNADLPAETLDRVAPIVGTGAVMFANLVSQREKDVDFEWEKVIALSGDSGPYVQYSHARCASIMRRAGERIAPSDLETVDFGKLTHDAEWAVARRLLELPDAAVRASESCEPHIVCHYLLQLAGDFSYWYTLGNGDASLRVLCEDPATRRARLALVAAVQAALATGLALLGIGAPEQM